MCNILSPPRGPVVGLAHDFIICGSMQHDGVSGIGGIVCGVALSPVVTEGVRPDGSVLVEGSTGDGKVGLAHLFQPVLAVLVPEVVAAVSTSRHKRAMHRMELHCIDSKDVRSHSLALECEVLTLQTLPSLTDSLATLATCEPSNLLCVCCAMMHCCGGEPQCLGHSRGDTSFRPREKRQKKRYPVLGIIDSKADGPCNAPSWTHAL